MLYIALSSKEECNGLLAGHHIIYNVHSNASSRVGKPPLVAAVSEAGGLGTCLHLISCYSSPISSNLGILTALTQPNPEALRIAIRETRKLTSKPFGINITLLPSINPPDYAGFARVAVEEGVKIVETAGNNRKQNQMQDLDLCHNFTLHSWRSH